jgi:hypothetical protein
MFSLELLSNPFFWIFVEKLDSLQATSAIILAVCIIKGILLFFAQFPFDNSTDKATFLPTKQLIVISVACLAVLTFVPASETVYKAMAYSTGANAVQTFFKSPQAKELNSISLNALKRLNEVLEKTEKTKYGK